MSMKIKDFRELENRKFSSIAKSRIFEVYESLGKRRQLYTLNLAPGSSVYGERLVKENDFEYREWDA